MHAAPATPGIAGFLTIYRCAISTPGALRAQVLEEGALQPVIGLLSSSCTESQRESALLLGQFATTEPDYKAKIVQRGAVGAPPAGPPGPPWPCSVSCHVALGGRNTVVTGQSGMGRHMIRPAGCCTGWRGQAVAHAGTAARCREPKATLSVSVSVIRAPWGPLSFSEGGCGGTRDVPCRRCRR